ncbi:50S ribosomal protein L23 [Candidatus Woesebacteria bacterium]|jgi:large subunit ribosomal protein L23|nr:50S ribosomal protein L23 [Candidatus Woesebacteria bacterium]
MRLQDVVIKPLITEKALSKGAGNEYLFEVSEGSNKHNIKVAIEQMFDVEVKEVKTLIRKGKVRRTGRRMKLKTLPNTKKAYVVLKKGSIDIIPKA